MKKRKANMIVDNWINFGMLFVTIFSAGFTYYQWKKINRKIGTINVSRKAIEILPAWYTTRMMPMDFGEGKLARDYWPFGLLMSDGRTLVVTGIHSLSDDGKWMDIELATKNEWSIESNQNYIFAVANDRKKASIQVACINVAMELASS
jgi:hypothetical protein